LTQPPFAGEHERSHDAEPPHVTWQPLAQPVMAQLVADLHVCWHPLPTQSSLQVLPDAQSDWQPPPAHVKEHDAFASHVNLQPPPGQSNEQLVPAWHVIVQPFPSPGHALAQLPPVHSQALPPVHDAGAVPLPLPPSLEHPAKIEAANATQARNLAMLLDSVPVITGDR
jgi:hypothetical protein